MILRAYPCVAYLIAITSVFGDGPADNHPDKVRPVPPPGIEIPQQDRVALTQAASQFGRDIELARNELSSRPHLLSLLPDVEIYHKAVDWALRYGEFFRTNEPAIARSLIERGQSRLTELRSGETPWTTATGLVVRGYRSRIDGSVQPYGLVIPPSYTPLARPQFRLDLWFHGRGETLSELAFINRREESPGEFTPAHTFILHLYGRYCNGSKFAGETDAFEALEHVRQRYPIDEDRLVIRGFSLGGASCWHMAVHHAWRWAAAAPGAGFSETPEFLRIFQKEKLNPEWYQRKLWHLYDCPDWALNLFHCPVVAYSGEKDIQKQAADIMSTAMAREGLDLVHIIGPGTGHRYHIDAKRELNQRIDRLAARGREPVPTDVRLVTWTLKYNRMYWVILDGLEQHWKQASVQAELSRSDNSVRITTDNVTALTVSFSPGEYPFDNTRVPRLFIDGSKPPTSRVRSDRSWTASFRRKGSRWRMVTRNETKLRKRHGLQGPIDDAFTEPFLMVRPTGKALNARVSDWVKSELTHATNHWRLHFRGDAPVKDDSAITDEDIATKNLILWGDPSSNRVLARIASKLPMRWDTEVVKLGKASFEASYHLPILIYPNPLNPKRYIVLNSSFTFREYDYLNNARQVPKLPDYAIVDLREPISMQTPGKIVLGGFFDEEWRLIERGSRAW